MSFVKIRRSALYVPASRERALSKARDLAVDCLILDLEDAVAPAAKEQARERAVAFAQAGGWRARELCVRCNALASPWGSADVRAIAGSGCDALLLPKLQGSAELEALCELLRASEISSEPALWAMLETPSGILDARSIAAHPSVEVLVVGTNDLHLELRAPMRAGREAVLPALSLALLAARAEGKAILDGVFGDVRDADGFEREARQGRELGFDGKTLIHPGQIAATHAIWSPSASELEEARRVKQAFEAAVESGAGVALLDGRMIEALHVEMAERVLALAEALG
jgi:citrate lyase subunit beta/citryl-CoA lyase